MRNTIFRLFFARLRRKPRRRLWGGNGRSLIPHPNFLAGIILMLFFSFYALVFLKAEVLTERTFPQRIISLGPFLTEELFLLSAQDKIVGVTTYCRRPPEAETKEKVGTVVEIDIERIMGLKPDLVLTTPLTNLKQVERLKSLGIEVVHFPLARDFSQICEQFLRLAKIVDREGEAQNIVREAQNIVDAIKKKTQKFSKPKVFVQIGAKPLATITEGSFINDLIGLAGGVNITSGAKGGLYSREEVLKQNPEIIVIATMGISGKKEKEAWEKYKTVRAVRKKKIFVVDSYHICSLTPLSFVDALEEIFEIFHGRGNSKKDGDRG